MSTGLHRMIEDIGLFSRVMMPHYRLRAYQREPAQAILDSVIQHQGRQFAIVFSRQAGKDELLAQLVTMLLFRYSQRGGTVVIAAPTLRPQAALSRDRLRDRVLGHPLTASMLTPQAGGGISLGKARARFVSAAPGANARGQTADLLLVANEAQDIQPDIWDAVFDPMAASTNATTLFLGTVWSKATLLARQMRHLRQLEAQEQEQEQDGHQRVFLVPWQRVAADVPAYGERVRARMTQLGEDHPFIRTEYCLEELDGDGGLFPEHRIAQMRGDHPRQANGTSGKRYAMLLDVAGEEESGSGPLAFVSDQRRDSTALTIVEVDSATRPDGRPVYRVVDRRLWMGQRHSALHATLVDLAQNVWKASWLVVDATGIGAGLASFLASALERSGTRVLPFVFTASSKSRLGWDFLGLIDSGRFKEYRADGADVTRLYEAQLRATTFEVLRGPGNLLRWSVPEAAGHDDLVISAALCAALDEMDLRPRIARGA
jgi:hypothetical protein